MATPTFTRQKARIQKAQNNDDDAVTSEITTGDHEVNDDTFLEELFNTSMESLETSDNSDIVYPMTTKGFTKRVQPHSLLQVIGERKVL